jgi:hypothetical protein
MVAAVNAAYRNPDDLALYEAAIAALKDCHNSGRRSR